MGAVLADIARHQPAEVTARVTVEVRRVDASSGLFDLNRPGVRAERTRIDDAHDFGDPLADRLTTRRSGRQLREAGVLSTEGLGLLYESNVSPRVGAEHAGVVEGHAEQLVAVVRDGVPLLARDLAGLAADADRGVGEEPHPRRWVDVAGVARHVGFSTAQSISCGRTH